MEVDLETTRQNCKENMQQTVLTEKERFTQMQWDMEELHRRCLDLESQLKSEQVLFVLPQIIYSSLLFNAEVLMWMMFTNIPGRKDAFRVNKSVHPS